MCGRPWALVGTISCRHFFVFAHDIQPELYELRAGRGGSGFLGPGGPDILRNDPGTSRAY